MDRENLKKILNILKCGDEKSVVSDWYSALGFLEINRVAGLFFNRSGGVEIPVVVRRRLSERMNIEAGRAAAINGQIILLADILNFAEVKHSFLKGSVMSHCYLKTNGNEKMRLYQTGERSSNDIDILVMPESLSKIDKLLRAEGFIQGYFDFKKNAIIELNRTEIMSRRMNRGETAPYMKYTDNPYLPFVEIDVNFSVDHLPYGKKGLLNAMLDSVHRLDMLDMKTNEKKCGLVSALDNEFFFIHLLLHQFKEMRVFSMVKRFKDSELYKYCDIYYFIKSGLINNDVFWERVLEFGLHEEVSSVLYNTYRIFESDEIKCLNKTVTKYCPKNALMVFDPENKNKEYLWEKHIEERLCNFDNLGELNEYE